MEKCKKIDVSIIVPVYNVALYLRKCIDSLVNQDYDKKKYEIIFIDDCSIDDSLNILNEYKEKYDNINIYNLKKNMGVSYARNIGIKQARGEYLIFCDADDTYEKNTIAIFMSTIDKEQCDFVAANHYVQINSKNIPIYDSNLFNSRIPTREEIICYLSISSCAKIIKRNLFIKNNIFYPVNVKRYEELSVIPKLAFLSKKTVVINDCLYHYIQRKTSASNNNKEFNKEIIKYMHDSINEFIKIFDEKKYKDEIEFRIIDLYAYGLLLVLLKMGVSNDLLKNEIDYLNKKYPNLLNNKYLNKYSMRKKIFIKLIIRKHILVARIYAKLHQLLTG